jgi:predicted glutamine amidotransferase
MYERRKQIIVAHNGSRMGFVIMILRFFESYSTTKCHKGITKAFHKELLKIVPQLDPNCVRVMNNVIPSKCAYSTYRSYEQSKVSILEGCSSLQQ